MDDVTKEDIGSYGMRLLGFLQWFSDERGVHKESFIRALKGEFTREEIELIMGEFIRKKMVIDLPIHGIWLLKHKYNIFSRYHPANKDRLTLNLPSADSRYLPKTNKPIEDSK